MIKKFVKLLLRKALHFDLIRRIRYSETGWSMYFLLFRKVKKRLTKEWDFYAQIKVVKKVKRGMKVMH